MNPPGIDRPALLELLRTLISIESVNPALSDGGSGEGKIAAFLAEYLLHLGLETELHPLGSNRYNVIARYPGQGDGPALLLNGHLDTVGVSGMAIDPFDPKVEGGRVFGRGSIDMKSGVAAQVAALAALAQAGIALKGTVVLTCVADEEYESLGTVRMLEHVYADAAIVSEPTDLRIAVAHKGFVWAKVKIKGNAAHGSMPEKGIDAIVQAGRVLAGLDALEREHLPKRVHPMLGRASVHASTIRGGTAISVYPDLCELLMERRTLPGEGKEVFAAELAGILAQARAADPRFSAEAETWFDRPAVEISPQAPIVRSLADSFLAESGASPRIGGVPFWTDAALIAAAGIPAVNFGPAGEGLHAAVEYVEFESVISTARILLGTILGFCGKM
jgi:acetylornithine deacetylase